MLKKILVAVDGSPYSTHSLRYLGQLFQNLPDIHFHLLSLVPASSLGSAARDWLSEAELLNTVSPATRKLPYDAVKDFTPITLVAASPWVMVVSPK